MSSSPSRPFYSVMPIAAGSAVRCQPLLRPFLAAATLILPFVLGGCPAVVVGGLAAAGGAGYVASQERGVNGIFDDGAVKAAVQDGFQRVGPILRYVNVTVYQGRVLLTGQVPDPTAKQNAAQLTTGTPGVRAVYDEVEVRQTTTGWDDAKDEWIRTRLRSDMVFDSQIRSVNYTIEVANHSVYLIGSARTQAELDRVIAYARVIPGVRRVVSYVEIRPGAPPASGGTYPPPAQGGYPPPASFDTPPPAPPVAVEVHPL